jgi:hypothetical protein
MPIDPIVSRLIRSPDRLCDRTERAQRCSAIEPCHGPKFNRSGMRGAAGRAAPVARLISPE